MEAAGDPLGDGTMAFPGQFKTGADQGCVDIRERGQAHLNREFEHVSGECAALQHPSAGVVDCHTQLGQNTGALQVGEGAQVQFGLG